jgi:hypothetical protein
MTTEQLWLGNSCTEQRSSDGIGLKSSITLAWNENSDSGQQKGRYVLVATNNVTYEIVAPRMGESSCESQTCVRGVVPTSKDNLIKE